MLGPAQTANCLQGTIPDVVTAPEWYVQRRPERAAASTATSETSRPMMRAAARRNRPCDRVRLGTAGAAGQIRICRGDAVMVARGALAAAWGAVAAAAACGVLPGATCAGGPLVTGMATVRTIGIWATNEPDVPGRSQSRGTRQVDTVTPTNGDAGSPQGADMAAGAGALSAGVARTGAGIAGVRRGVARPPSTGMAISLAPVGRRRVTSSRSMARAAPLGSRARTDEGSVRAPGHQDTGAGGATARRKVARARTRNTSILPVDPTSCGVWSPESTTSCAWRQHRSVLRGLPAHPAAQIAAVKVSQGCGPGVT